MLLVEKTSNAAVFWPHMLRFRPQALVLIGDKLFKCLICCSLKALFVAAYEKPQHMLCFFFLPNSFFLFNVVLNKNRSK